MSTQIHDELVNLTGNKPALVFSFEALKGFLINNFINAHSTMLNNSVSMDGFPDIQARFIGLSVQPRDFVMKLDERNGEFYFTLSTSDPVANPLFATVVIHAKSSPQDEFSRLTITISDFEASLSVLAPYLKIGTPDFKVASKLIPSATRAAVLNATHINESDVSAVEGALSYVMPRRVLNAMFTTISTLDVSKLFTAFDLKGNWTAAKTSSDAFIIIPSDGITVKANLGCPERDSAPNLSITTGALQTNSPTSLTWPIAAANLDPLQQRIANDVKDGFGAILMPKTLLEQRFGSIMPGINYVEDGSAFIGYDLSFFVSFKNFQLNINPARHGFTISLDFITNGKAAFYIDVPCVGKFDLATADLKGDVSSLTIYLGFVLTRDGKLKLDAQIDSLNIGNINVDISFFAKWLTAFAGGEGAVIGFILDKVVGRIIGNILPGKLHDVVTDAVNSKNIQLLDFASILPFSKYGKFNEVSYSGRPDSILVGMLSNG